MMSKDAIGVVDYGMGNLRSVAKAFESVGFHTVVSGNPKELAPCRGVVLPGVGAFRDCMRNLSAQGLIPFLRETIDLGRPFLGICLGLQLLFSESEEFGVHRGFDVIPGKVVRFPAGLSERAGEGDVRPLKIPHMGWNRVDFEMADHPVFRALLKAAVDHGRAEAARAAAVSLRLGTR